MKKVLPFGFVLFALSIYAQPNTEIYLLDITTVNGNMELTNPKNISNNEGYDNQPSFYDNNTILFSRTRNGQTDIAKYDMASGSITWISDTPGGSEYSPLRIPNSTDISAVRLDTTGLQRLYRYDSSSGKSKLLRNNAEVGYQLWHSENILVNTILVNNGMDLVLSNLKDNTNQSIQKNVGRSLHKIPNTDLISFISKQNGLGTLNSINPISGTTKQLSKLPANTDDVCWWADGSVLVPKGNSIYKFKPASKENPQIINLPDKELINSISRMAVSPDGKNLVLVSEEPASKVVQKQVESYNTGNLDAFVNCYAEDVVVRNFPLDTLYVGHEKMLRKYSGLSPENKIYTVEVVKRITIGNKVIDHEKVTGKGKTQMQVAIYEVENGTISGMTFIFDDSAVPYPETIVQKQLDAYNARAIDAFLQTYAEDVCLYDFPAVKRSQGKEEMRKGYTGFFETTLDLHCEIRNRIVIANKVIDEEYITANGNNFSAVAIYEVENGKISKVTFLR